MEFDEAKGRGECEEEEHRVKEDEARDAEPSNVWEAIRHSIWRVGMQLTTQNTYSNPMASESRPPQLPSRPPCDWY